MTLPTRIDDHTADGLPLLISQYRDLPRLESILRSWLDRCSELEAVFWDVIDSRLIDTATGDALRKLGKLVGQAPVGDNDETYRTYIKARIRINRSRGRADDVIAMLRILAPAIFHWFEWELGGAEVIFETTPTQTQAGELAGLIGLARAAGVGVIMRFPTHAQPFTFRYSAKPSDPTLGFSYSGGSDGGRWSHAEQT